MYRQEPVKKSKGKGKKRQQSADADGWSSTEEGAAVPITRIGPPKGMKRARQHYSELTTIPEHPYEPNERDNHIDTAAPPMADARTTVSHRSTDQGRSATVDRSNTQPRPKPKPLPRSETPDQMSSDDDGDFPIRRGLYNDDSDDDDDDVYQVEEHGFEEFGGPPAKGVATSRQSSPVGATAGPSTIPTQSSSMTSQSVGSWSKSLPPGPTAGPSMIPTKSSSSRDTEAAVFRNTASFTQQTSSANPSKTARSSHKSALIGEMRVVADIDEYTHYDPTTSNLVSPSETKSSMAFLRLMCPKNIAYTDLCDLLDKYKVRVLLCR